MTANHSSAFSLFHRAILGRHPMSFTYRGHLREVCPHILGHSGGQEKALVFQFGGQSSKGLPARGEWRCFDLSEVSDITLHDAGSWHTGRQHTLTQRCVDRAEPARAAVAPTPPRPSPPRAQP